MAAKVASSKVVRYIGTADVREIDAQGWKNAGVEDQHKVVWSSANNWEVSVADLTEAAVNYCDTGDSGFVVADASV
jgi:hypothetical protein